MSAALGLWMALVGAPEARSAPAPIQAQALASRVYGRVRQAGTRTPLAGATVLAVPAPDDAPLGPVPSDQAFDPEASPPAWVRMAEVDDDGRFSFDALEGPRVRLLVNASGHTRLEVVIDLAQLPKRGVALYAVPDESTAFRTVVEAAPEPEPSEVTRAVLEPEEIRTAPGTQGDALRAIQNLPGVARSPGGVGILAIRGASPSQSRVFLDGHPIPRAFHSMALASVVPAAALDRLEFIPSNFGVRYGDATGGLVVLHPASSSRRGIHGSARVDLLGMGALASGTVGRGSYLVAAQRGWVDAVLRTAEAVDATQQYLLPKFYDYQAFFDHPVGAGTLSARVLGAGDRVQSRVPGLVPPDVEPIAFEIGSQFHRADLSYRLRRRAWSFWLSPSFRVERNVTRQPINRAESSRTDTIFSLRAEATRTLSRHLEVLAGADLELDRYVTAHDLGLAGTEGLLINGNAIPSASKGVQSSMGSYLQLQLRAGRWVVVPGLRASGFTVGTAAKAALDPRVSAHWSFAPRWRWSLGAGLYSQGVVPQRVASGGFLSNFAAGAAGVVILPPAILSLEPRAGFAPRADAVFVQRAIQGSTALSRELGESWYVELGAWGRIIDNADGTRYDLSGEAHPRDWTWSSAYGLEAMVRRRLGPRLWGWVGYTLSRSDRRVFDPTGDEPTRRVFPTNFDQRHNLIVLASYRLPRNWRIGGRFRLVSGSPFTDAVGVVWIPQSENSIVAGGSPNGARFPLFHQLDLRVDKSWIRRWATVGVYMDVQNVYNRVNPEAYVYDHDVQRRNQSLGLPIFPSLGLRVDF